MCTNLKFKVQMISGKFKTQKQMNTNLKFKFHVISWQPFQTFGDTSAHCPRHSGNSKSSMTHLMAFPKTFFKAFLMILFKLSFLKAVLLPLSLLLLLGATRRRRLLKNIMQSRIKMLKNMMQSRIKMLNNIMQSIIKMLKNMMQSKIKMSLLMKSRWLLLPWIVAWAPIVPAGRRESSFSDWCLADHSTRLHNPYGALYFYLPPTGDPFIPDQPNPLIAPQ